jgi:hypothetical protein
MVSMITVINMPEGTTHKLWLPEQDNEWIWEGQHARMDNSPPMISRAGQRINMGWSAWSQPPTCHNAPLTNYDCQSSTMRWSAWSQSPTYQNAQLTLYECQSRTMNGHGMISMFTVTNMLEWTTHKLWLPEQDNEWTWCYRPTLIFPDFSLFFLTF